MNIDNYFAAPKASSSNAPVETRSGCLRKLLAGVLLAVSVLSAIVAVFGFVSELRGDGFVDHEVLALIVLTVTPVAWVRAAWLLVKARSGAGWWFLAPFAVALIIVFGLALFFVLTSL